MFTLLEPSIFKPVAQMLPSWLTNLIETQQSFDNANPSQSGVAAIDLTPLMLINVTGDDAQTFLQSQFSNDIQSLSENACQFSSYCNPKGRALCVIRIMRHTHGFWLLIPTNVSDGIIKRLNLYKMRAKVMIEPATTTSAFGLIGSPTLNLGDAIDSNHIYRIEGKLSAISDHIAEDTQIERSIVIVPSDTADTKVNIMPHSVWQLSDILCGIPQIYNETIESFIPQMINVDLVEGINFNKGCYPGQEIIARLRYLGKLKQRMAIALVETEDTEHTEICPGALLYDSNKPEQKVGMIVDGVRITNSSAVATIMVSVDYLPTVETTNDSGNQTVNTLTTVAGNSIHIQPLPYDIPANKDRQKVG